MNKQARDWANILGMLPIGFLHNQHVGVEKYAMLNGYQNNFCLSFINDQDERLIKSSAWSANMSNYVSVDLDNDTLFLFSLDRPATETIRYHYVKQNLPQFYKYLGTHKFGAKNGIVPFVMRYYRIVRHALLEEGTAGNALKAFLYMLAMLDNENANQWKLPEGIDEIVARIGNQVFEEVTLGMNEGLKDLNLIPDVKLLLRHSAGMLFQEANYVARFSNQLELFPSDSIRYEMSPKMMGAYYTPGYIARSIVEEAMRHLSLSEMDSITIFDPACGSGVFLVEALHQLKFKSFRGHVNVIGWDIDPIAIDMVNFILQFEKTEWNDGMDYFGDIKNSMDPEIQWPHADIILMNPPYNSWANMNEEQRGQASSILSYMYRPNMASVFYCRAACSVNPNGSIGALMPSSFLMSDSHSAVRREAYAQVQPRLIAHLGNYVFSTAMADVSIIIASNNNLDKSVQMLWTNNVDAVTPLALRHLRQVNNNPMLSFAQGKEFNIYEERLEYLNEKDSWMPLPLESLRQKYLIEGLFESGDLVKAEDLFHIRMGARTGVNDVFIISKEEYNRIPTKERIYFRPSIDNSAIRDGLIDSKNYLFFPYPEEIKGFTDEDDLKKKIPYVYNHFFERKMMALTQRDIKEGKWWLLSRPRPWQFQPEDKIVSTEFGKAGSFAFDRKGEYVVERGMAWVLKERNTSTNVYYFYIAIFNSRFFNSLLQIYARQLAGGAFFNLEGKFMRNIPLPVMEKIDDQIVDVLIGFGKRICEEGNREVEGLTSIVRNLYGA